MVCMLAACYLNSIQHVAVSLLYMLNQNVYLCWSSCCYIVLCWKTRSKWNQLVVTVEKIYCFCDAILVTFMVSKTYGCMGVSRFYLIYHIPSIVHSCLKQVLV